MVRHSCHCHATEFFHPTISSENILYSKLAPRTPRTPSTNLLRSRIFYQQTYYGTWREATNLQRRGRVQDHGLRGVRRAGSEFRARLEDLLSCSVSVPFVRTFCVFPCHAKDTIITVRCKADLSVSHLLAYLNSAKCRVSSNQRPLSAPSRRSRNNLSTVDPQVAMVHLPFTIPRACHAINLFLSRQEFA